MGDVCIPCFYSTKIRTLSEGPFSKGGRKGLVREGLDLQNSRSTHPEPWDAARCQRSSPK